MNIKIGKAAGVVYHRLEEGECSLNQIKVRLDAEGYDMPFALLTIGWLAREDKIEVEKGPNKWLIRLK